jgi:hypothetical protein
VLDHAAVEHVQADSFTGVEIERRRVEVVIAHDHVHVARRTVRARLTRRTRRRRGRTGKGRAEKDEAYSERCTDDQDYDWPTRNALRAA